jgi:GNAT superfamily N-acetyltransferase
MSVDPAAVTRLAHRIDVYLDAAPRAGSEVLDVGPLRVFLSRLRWPYYARPRPEVDLQATTAVTAADLQQAAAAMRAANRPVSFEWIEEEVPSMTTAAHQAGLDVTQYPMLVLDELIVPETAPGITLRLLVAEDPDLLLTHVVADLAFSHGGAAIGEQGATERGAALDNTRQDEVREMRTQLRTGRTVAAAAYDADGMVGSARLNPVADVPDVAEIVAVAVLPAYRRRGIAAALTALLAQTALDLGIEVVMLSAGSPEVARVYERIGFRPVGHTATAAPRH